MHSNTWSVLGDPNKFAVCRHAGPGPTLGHVVFKEGAWEIEDDEQGRRFSTRSEAADTLVSEFRSPR
jgi:hypothetical protein